MTGRIDSHQHFWRPARGDYGWLRADAPALAPLVRDFLPEHLVATLKAHRIGRTVLVQAAPSDAETEFMLALADRHDFIGGVVGWVDLGSSDAAERLERLSLHPKFKGVRPMLQDLPDIDWIAHAPHPDALRSLARLGLRFDALVKPSHLEPLLRFLRAWPEIPVVIDHAAKPPIGDVRGMAEWRRRIADVAAQPQVSCKFSGLWNEAPAALHHDAAAIARVLEPVRDHLLQCFGPGRVMWGSDWPVLTLAGDYAGWVMAGEALMDALSPSDRACIWHDSARRFYGIEPVSDEKGSA